MFSAEDPVSLAAWLLEEISRGLVPVWPSTPRYAARIVDGLVELHRTRAHDVMTALPTAPHGSVLDWQALFAPLHGLDAARSAGTSF